mgnify:CR=1 FL=1
MITFDLKLIKMKKIYIICFFIFCSSLKSQNIELSPYQKNTMNTKRFARPVNTGVNHTLLILGSAWSISPEIGDEIAVYDTMDNMVSSVAWRPEQQGHSGLAIFGDDETTSEKEGMKIGEIFKIVFFDASQETMYNINIEKFERGNNKYQKDGVTVVGSVSLGSQINPEIQLFQNVPNPVKNKTSLSFYLPQSGNVKIFLENSFGGLLKTVLNKSFQKGMHSFELDCDEIEAGVYFYTLEMNNSNLSKQFTVVK